MKISSVKASMWRSSLVSDDSSRLTWFFSKKKKVPTFIQWAKKKNLRTINLLWETFGNVFYMWILDSVFIIFASQFPSLSLWLLFSKLHMYKYICPHIPQTSQNHSAKLLVTIAKLTLNILSNWSMVSRTPGNVGTPVIISMNIQPTPHISKEVE